MVLIMKITIKTLLPILLFSFLFNCQKESQNKGQNNSIIGLLYVKNFDDTQCSTNALTPLGGTIAALNTDTIENSSTRSGVVGTATEVYVISQNSSGFNTLIKKLSNGTFSNFAGSTTSGDTDATGTNAAFTSLTSIVADSSGNLYVVDEKARKVKKITTAGVVTTLVTYVNETPRALAIDKNNNIFISVNSGKINKLDSNLNLTVYKSGISGNPPAMITVDSSGNLYYTTLDSAYTYGFNGGSGTIIKIGTDLNTSTFATIPTLYAISADSKGNIYALEGGTSSVYIRGAVQKISSSGTATKIIQGSKVSNSSCTYNMPIYPGYAISLNSNDELFLYGPNNLVYKFKN